ncbi:Protein FAM86A [Ilyonectria robusta]
MSTLSILLATPLAPEATSVQQKCYVTYQLSSLAGGTLGSQSQESPRDPHVTLLENRSLISAAGTTGLRTWEAALHLGVYLCENSSIIKGKRILELGAGTGYLSILCANFLGSPCVIASDGSDDVINNLPENLFLNNLQDSNAVVPMEVKWGHALMGTEEDKWNGGRPVDVVLGADITYDQRIIPALVGTLLDVFQLHPAVEVYISATQRNEATFQVFLDKCQINGLAVEDLQFEVPSRETQEGPFYNDKFDGDRDGDRNSSVTKPSSRSASWLTIAPRVCQVSCSLSAVSNSLDASPACSRAVSSRALDYWEEGRAKLSWPAFDVTLAALALSIGTGFSVRAGASMGADVVLIVDIGRVVGGSSNKREYPGGHLQHSHHPPHRQCPQDDRCITGCM